MVHAQQHEHDESFMRMALAEAQVAAAAGEVPIGAVVVHEPIDRGTRRSLAEPRVVARAHNLRETLRNPAAHAEHLAMEAAARELDAWRLTDCTVYVTLEPCIMCAGLMHQARISRCVYGAPDQKAGALGTLYQVHADERLNHRFEVTSGVLADESTALLQAFFRSRR
ncbi:nucleoside deaminase [Adlercreutzia murintestinalis]|uniref:nucleoside deaminase n=1 Tax=Adlercreutzia murintestinalis TaxID=2941325 RepID=UPI00255834F1|nr:nucleoside deaminase [Adlercreutzia murintestinalis]